MVSTQDLKKNPSIYNIMCEKLLLCLSQLNTEGKYSRFNEHNQYKIFNGRSYCYVCHDITHKASIQDFKKYRLNKKKINHASSYWYVCTHYFKKNPLL